MVFKSTDDGRWLVVKNRYGRAGITVSDEQKRTMVTNALARFNDFRSVDLDS